ncbi:Uncharacterised protein [Mycobacterium tuberculosis]|nr:Uncharacterised protein [Mycobacterium tuberculosis]
MVMGPLGRPRPGNGGGSADVVALFGWVAR